ncbi:MAG TPA: hypothetical protein VL832_16640 [Puia sp.]|jgi:hypothetical protein|nr:hypothetical protein [Puia sp.]
MTKTENLEEEIKNLEAENAKLRKELASRKRSYSGTYDRGQYARGQYDREQDRYERTRDDISDTMQDTTRTLADETSKVVRGMTLSFFEGIRVYAEAWNVFADEVTNRNQSGTYASAGEQARSLPGDIFSGMARSYNKLTEIPSRAIDRFYSAYQEGADRSDRYERSERSDRSARAGRSERFETTERSEGPEKTTEKTEKTEKHTTKD